MYCGYINFLMMFMFMVLILLIFSFMSIGSIYLLNFNVMIISLKVFSLGYFSDLEILLTIWNYLFLMMVLLISISVLFFSCSYMTMYSVQNFIYLYLLFIISMFWLILSNNFYWMMFGWDGSGVVSFLLIIYYMNNESSVNGLFTIFQNRIGDLFFIFFLILMIDLSMWSSLMIKSMIIMLLIGASVKSAQYPFNAWLLTAMSAPTPISSLVHSSTLVVAGVYILLQYSYCLIDNLEVLKYLSLLTLLVSLFGLINESDMKKLIAYSTMSHVGLMMLMISLQLYKVTYFHLNIHAMFKSLMFMCFGFIMLCSFHSQDKRLVSMMNLNPLIKIFYNFSCLMLLGLPFLTAFFSKDFIIEKSLEFSGEMSSIILLFLFLSVSIYYSFKLLKLDKSMFVWSQIEKQYIGFFSLFIMSLVSIVMVNVFISMIFSLSLELFNSKMFIYLFMLVFMFLAILTNINLKMFSYDKNFNFMEIFMINWYSLDIYVYFTFVNIINLLNFIFNLKMVIMVNWWVMVILIWFF